MFTCCTFIVLTSRGPDSGCNCVIMLEKWSVMQPGKTKAYQLCSEFQVTLYPKKSRVVVNLFLVVQLVLRPHIILTL